MWIRGVYRQSYPDEQPAQMWWALDATEVNELRFREKKEEWQIAQSSDEWKRMICMGTGKQHARPRDNWKAFTTKNGRSAIIAPTP